MIFGVTKIILGVTKTFFAPTGNLLVGAKPFPVGTEGMFAPARNLPVRTGKLLAGTGTIPAGTEQGFCPDPTHFCPDRRRFCPD